MSGFSRIGWIGGVDMYESFPRHLLKMKDYDSLINAGDNMELMNWREFYFNYQNEIHELIDYFNEDDEFNLSNILETGKELILLVDTSTHYKDCMTKSIKRKYRKSAGRDRREKMREHYHYMYLLPRIHGFMMIADIDPTIYSEDMIRVNKSGLEHKKILQLVNITTSRYTNRCGVGTYMLECLKIVAKHSDYSDIILEVANNIVEEPRDFMEYDIKYPDENEDFFTKDEKGEELAGCLIEVLSEYFWKIGMRLVGKEQYYNIDKDYIDDFLEGYFMSYKEVRPYGFQYPEKFISNIVKYNEYGGKLYREGKKSSERLINFYEDRGFMEAPYVNTEWKAFSPMPYVSMIHNIYDTYMPDNDDNDDNYLDNDNYLDYKIEMNGMLI